MWPSGVPVGKCGLPADPLPGSALLWGEGTTATDQQERAWPGGISSWAHGLEWETFGVVSVLHGLEHV